MSSEHLVGTSIPRFTFDTPTTPGNDFYALCAGTEPLCMIFLPGFDHPVTREYLTRYLKTLTERACRAEIDELYFTVLCDKDIFRADIPVDHAETMDFCQ